jgi:uncharacterized protein
MTRCRPGEVYEAARAFRVPILFDVAGQAYVIDMVAPSYPDVNFIIPHFGSFSDDRRVQQQVVDLLVRYPNVYADTSGVRRFDYIVQAVARAGAKKVIFVSDGPWLHPRVELHKIRLLGLPSDQRSLILGGNVMRLMRQVRTGSKVVERSLAIKQLTRTRITQPKRETNIDRQLPPPINVEHEL